MHQSQSTFESWQVDLSQIPSNAKVKDLNWHSLLTFESWNVIDLFQIKIPWNSNATENSKQN